FELPRFFSSHVAHRDLHSFPTRRSSDLDRLQEGDTRNRKGDVVHAARFRRRAPRVRLALLVGEDGDKPPVTGIEVEMALLRIVEDRKSTRLNSSHVKISYAVFCLKKKTA